MKVFDGKAIRRKFMVRDRDHFLSINQEYQFNNSYLTYMFTDYIKSQNGALPFIEAFSGSNTNLYAAIDNEDDLFEENGEDDEEEDIVDGDYEDIEFVEEDDDEYFVDEDGDEDYDLEVEGEYNYHDDDEEYFYDDDEDYGLDDEEE